MVDNIKMTQRITDDIVESHLLRCHPLATDSLFDHKMMSLRPIKRQTISMPYCEIIGNGEGDDEDGNCSE